jgi:DNA-binding CsgD family transcriptional regulator
MASHSIGLFERVAIDAEQVTTIGGCRRALLGAVASLLGADSAALLDPPWAHTVARDFEERSAALGTSQAYAGPYFENRQRWQRSLRKLMAAMRVGPTIDTDIYAARERDRLAVYQELFRPQGATTILATLVPHGGSVLAMLVFKRNGRATRFLDHDAQVLSSVLPAIGLADAGFQFAFDASVEAAAEPLPSDGLSPREVQVAGLAYKGMRNSEIAALLGTSSETVKKQLARAMEKMEVSNRTELAMVWGNTSSRSGSLRLGR